VALTAVLDMHVQFLYIPTISWAISGSVGRMLLNGRPLPAATCGCSKTSTLTMSPSRKRTTTSRSSCRGGRERRRLLVGMRSRRTRPSYTRMAGAGVVLGGLNVPAAARVGLRPAVRLDDALAAQRTQDKVRVTITSPASSQLPRSTIRPGSGPVGDMSIKLITGTIGSSRRSWIDHMGDFSAATTSTR
jgi:hypothetical protein